MWINSIGQKRALTDISDVEISVKVFEEDKKKER